MSPNVFLSRPVDVLAPCAFGEVISTANVATLRCSIVVGAANNPLSTPDLAVVLAARDVLYVLDFLANCGGIIHVGAEPLGLSEARVEQLLDDAVARTTRVLNEATAEGRLPLVLAQELAARRIAHAADTTAPVRVEVLA